MTSQVERKLKCACYALHGYDKHDNANCECPCHDECPFCTLSIESHLPIQLKFCLRNMGIIIDRIMNDK